MRPLLALGLLIALGTPAAAQHSFSPQGAAYDPAVPTPVAVLGYEIGARFTPHHMILRYAERLAAASARMRLDTVAHTFEGRPVLMAILTSEANQARIEQIRQYAQRLMDPRGASAAELDEAVARLPSIVWLGYTVHGGEASGTEAALALMYQLAAGQDAQTRLILDSTVVLIDPVQNPDGHERHVQDVMRARSALGVPATPGALIHQGSWPGPRTSHYNFDLNRDWFILSHPATRGRVAAFNDWGPHVAVDLHEMGSNSTYFFAPPMEPVNKNVHASIIEWWDIYAAANAAAFDQHGWSFFTREGYDEFYPGYGVSWPILTGAVGMTYEQASSSGGRIRRRDGTVLTLHEAVHHHYTAARATALTTARRRTERVRDYLEFRRSAITDHERGPIRTVIIERGPDGRADTLAARLIANGIEVQRLSSATDVSDATEYGATGPRDATLPAGAYVIDLAQPQGRLAKALLEPDAQLDSSFIREELERRRTGQSNRFYDVTAWSLPYEFRVRAWWTRSPVGPLEPVTAAPMLASPAITEAGYAYAFEPGSEASIRMLAGLLADSMRVWFAQRWFHSGEHRFPRGAFLARVAANGAGVHEAVRRHAAASGADVVPLASAMADEGTDLGSNSVVPIRIPRVALAGGQGISGYSYGFAWFAFDQRIRFPATTVDINSLDGPLLDEFNVLVVPSASAGALNDALGENGRERLERWVRDGGVLVTLDAATAWLADESTGLARLRLRQDTLRADSAGGAPLDTDVPGAIVRVLPDTLSPLLAGIRDEGFGVLVNSDRIYEAPRDLEPGEVVLRHAPEPRLRLAGYLWPEVPARLAGTPYLWTEEVGRGRVIGFVGDPNYRDQWRGLLPLFANAVFLGASF